MHQFNHHAYVGNVRNRVLSWCVEFIQDKQSTELIQSSVERCKEAVSWGNSTKAMIRACFLPLAVQMVTDGITFI